MPSDIRLRDDESGDEEWLVLHGNVLKSTTSDVMIDSPARRSGAGGRFRRALVHDEADGLTVNFNGDYPGGVRIVDAKLNLHAEVQHRPDPELPRRGSVGDIVFIHNAATDGITLDQFSVWLCIPGFGLDGNSLWRRIQLTDDEVSGTRD